MDVGLSPVRAFEGGLVERHFQKLCFPENGFIQVRLVKLGEFPV